jgi:hypothetical protein
VRWPANRLEVGPCLAEQFVGFIQPGQVDQDRGQRRTVGHEGQRFGIGQRPPDGYAVPRQGLSRLRIAAGVREPGQVVKYRGHIVASHVPERLMDPRVPAGTVGRLQRTIPVLSDHPQFVQQHGELNRGGPERRLDRRRSRRGPPIPPRDSRPPPAVRECT